MPSRSTTILVLLLAGLAGLLGWNYWTRPFATLPDPVEPQASASPQTSLDQRLANLTTEQKIKLLIAAPVTIMGSTSSATVARVENLDWVMTNQPGVVTLFGNQISSNSAEQVVSELDSRYTGAPYQPLIAVDHEGGSVQRLSGRGFTVLPSWQLQCAQPASVSAQALTASARELRRTGVDLVLAPMIDVATSHGVLRSRICAGDADLVADRAALYITAFTTEGIMPVLKHFPGIGRTTRDLHTAFDRVTIKPEDALLYKALLDQFPRIGVMIAHVGVTNQYPDVPCSLSLDCVKELIANYPEALVVSDALEMSSAGYLPQEQEPRTLPEVALRALMAGNSVLVFGPTVTEGDLDQVVATLRAAYESDPLVKGQVDRSVLKQLNMRSGLGKQ